MPTNKYLITSLIILIVLIISSGIFFSIKNLKNISFKQTSLIPEVKKEESAQDKAANLFNQGKFTELNEVIDSQLVSNQNDINLLLQKAQALAQEASLTFKEKELGDKAREFALKALALDPKSVQALTLIGYTYEIQEDYVNAHKYYDQALAIDPDNVDTLSQKGHAYDLEGKIKEAALLYEKALSKSSDEKILSNYARLISETKKDAAIELYKKILTISKNKRTLAEANYSLGMLSEEEKYNITVENFYTESINADPTFSLGYVGLAREQFKKSFSENGVEGKRLLVNNSISNLKKALEINPNQVYASMQLGIELYALNNKNLSNKILSNALLNVNKDISLSTKDKEKVKIVLAALIKAQK